MISLPPADSRRAALLVLIPTTLGYIFCQPGFGADGLAWLFLIPLILWAGSAPRWKLFAAATYLAMWTMQIVTMVWLRHVAPPMGYLGLVLLTGYFALYPALWALAARKILPGAANRALPVRVMEMLALAGLWVVLEWVKGHLFTGCPWMPLAATQWKIPPILALCAYAGPGGPAFAIVLFNLGLARYLAGLTQRDAGSALRSGLPISPWSGLRARPEFYVGMAPVLAGVLLFMRSGHAAKETLFTAALVQTDIDPNAKWNQQRAFEHLKIVSDLSLAAAKLSPEHPVWESGTPAPAAPKDFIPPDFVVWPESPLPFSIGDESYDRFLGDLAKHLDRSLIVGGDTRGPDGKGFYNGIFTVTPEDGVQKEFYAKRHLVPFGEYVPFADVLPLRKVVPVAMDFLRGPNDDPITVTRADGRTVRLGCLVCYEDIFPELARDMAVRGADALMVVTNETWYGRETESYQHAAVCSVICASTGLPMVRCGNSGWSGVISPTGFAKPVANAAGSIYFRGAGRIEVKGATAANRLPTFYVSHGDWFVKTCLGLVAIVWIRRRLDRRRRAVPASAQEETSGDAH